MLNAQKSMDRKTGLISKLKWARIVLFIARIVCLFPPLLPFHPKNTPMQMHSVHWLYCICSNTYSVEFTAFVCTCKFKHVILNEFNWRICYDSDHLLSANTPANMRSLHKSQQNVECAIIEIWARFSLKVVVCCHQFDWCPCAQ